MSTPRHVILPSLSDVAQRRWAELQSHCTDAGAFDCLDLVIRLAESQNIRCDVLVSEIDEVDHLAILLPWRSIGPYREVILPRFCPTTPMIVRSPLRRDARSALLRSALDHIRRHYHRAGVHAEAGRLCGATSPQWRSVPLFTYLVNLTDLPDDITRSWSAGTRRLFKRHRASYDVSEGHESPLVAIRLCAESYERSGRLLPANHVRLAEIVEHPPESLSTRTFVARTKDDGRLDAAVVILSHNSTSYYWIAGSRPGAGMTVLIGHVLSALASAGMTVFDFLGANTPSIAEFKRRFGPSLHEYVRLETSRSRLLDGLLAIRRRLLA